jgi:hypothetical protein
VIKSGGEGEGKGRRMGGKEERWRGERGRGQLEGDGRRRGKEGAV